MGMHSSQQRVVGAMFVGQLGQCTQSQSNQKET